MKVWPHASDVDWRWFFGLGAVPAIVGLVLRFEMPESPRWLIRKHRFDQARETFERLGVNVTVEDIEFTAAVNVAATYLAFRYIDRIGRRRLAMGGFAVVAAVGVGLLSGTPRIVVGMFGLSLFIASFAIGVGGTGWLIQGEMFPTAGAGRPRRSRRSSTGSPTMR